MATGMEENVTADKVEGGDHLRKELPDFSVCSDGNVCEIEATVVSGFEPLAKEEVEEKFGATAWTSRGRVNMLIPIEDVQKVMSLRSIDNVLLVLNRCSNFPFSASLDEALAQMRTIVPRVDWATAVQVWAKFFEFPHAISTSPVPNYGRTVDTTPSVVSSDPISDSCTGQNSVPHEESTDDIVSKNSSAEVLSSLSESSSHGKQRLPKNPLLPSFRATCNRSGTKHCFQSPQAAAHFGGEINNYFGWNVDLENFDIEVVLNIEDDNVRVCVALTKESLHRRDISNFGPTTLRPTIAYGMLRLCKIQEGESVCDPMCGGGSIPVEAALNWPLAHHFCGDIYGSAPSRTINNIQAVNNKRRKKQLNRVNIDVFRWDACSLPMKDNSVDVFVTDMMILQTRASLVGPAPEYVRELFVLKLSGSAIIALCGPWINGVGALPHIKIGSRLSNWHLYPRLLNELARVSKLETGRACLLTHDRKCITKCLNAVGHLWKRGPTIGVNIGGLAASVYLLFRTAALFKGAQE